jgi:hypothetical protein
MTILSFICDPCKQAADMGPIVTGSAVSLVKLMAKRSKHSQCPGGTHCDCQHRVRNIAK